MDNSASVRNFVMIAGFGGYFMIAALSSFFGVGGGGASLVFRALVAILSIILILNNLRTPSSVLQKQAFVAFLLGWLLYFGRILHDTVLVSLPLSQDVWYYWFWGAGASAIPMFALAMVPVSESSLKKLLGWVFALCWISALIVCMSGSSFVEGDGAGDLVDTGRLRLDSLNPILLGHLGCLVCMQSICVFMLKLSRSFWVRLVLLSAGVGVGGYLLVASNSRGPLVSFVLCFAFLVFAMRGRAKIGVILAGVGALVFFVPAAIFLEDSYGFTTYSRLFSQSRTDDVSSQIRLESYKGAIEGFLSNPLFGSGLEDRMTGYYPHNIILESFMATGVLGGSMFLFAIVVLLVFAFRSSRQAPGTIWIALAYVQFVVGAQFSGSIANSSYLWVSVGGLLSIRYVNRLRVNSLRA